MTDPQQTKAAESFYCYTAKEGGCKGVLLTPQILQQLQYLENSLTRYHQFSLD